MRKLTLILVGYLGLVSWAPAQTAAWRFRWQPDQVLTYRVEQVTNIGEVVGDKKSNFTDKLNLVKRWQVREVDNAGVATLQQSVVSMRREMTFPEGKPKLFDSTDPDKSDAQLREQLSKYVGVPLVVIRVNGQGTVVEVKESKYGPASRLESEPPFKITLPETAPSAGTEWSRAYRITLEPPRGTGEKYEASQKYKCETIEAGTAAITLTTTIAKLPEAAGDQIPLLEMQPAGEVVFDVKGGFLRSARVKIDKEVKGHQGEGSTFRYQSTYTETYVESK